jgi:CysZ protein
MLKQPELRPFVLIPLIINILIFSGFIWFSALQIERLSIWFEEWLWDWLDFLTFLLWPLFLILTLLIIAYTFTLVANLIAAPFNGLLAAKAESLLTQQKNPGAEQTTAQRSNGSIMLASIKREFAKLFYVLPLGLLLLIVSFIPMINILSYFIGAWLLAIEYGDYPMDGNELDFAQAKQKLRQRRLSSLGFGGFCMLATLIPVLNFFVMPAAVCGGVIFWKDELEAA